jgi:outer membrane receptor protein involved in Fe transport
MGRFCKRLLVSSALTVLAFSCAPSVLAAPAPASQPRTMISLPSGPLDKSLIDLGVQGRVKIMFQSQLVAGRTAPALHGQMTAREALDRLLAGSGIEVQQAQPGVLVLRPARQPIAHKRAAAPPSSPPRPADQRPVVPADDTVTELDEVVVGSHIRGVKDGPSPVIVIGREDIDRGGYATVADALTSLPQAFGGTTADDVALAGSDPTTTNIGLSTAVNLRGLGADATLVLINGRRMAGAGMMGDFADISMIPVAAVARIEVLTDGASALYGSDAVGGVVNIVLRDRYDGAETRARFGGSTRSDLGQYQLAQTLGRSWDTGSVLLTAEYQRRDRLAASRRDYAASTDLRPFGGTDHSVFYSQPGTVLVVDPTTFALTPGYAIPAGQDGTALTPGSFVPGKNTSNYRATMDLLPTQERGSVYLALSQAVGSHVTLNAEARYSDRRFSAYSYPPMAVLTVTPANPYFVSPNGSSIDYIAYSFANETGGSKSTGEVQSRSLAFGAKVDLPAAWRIDTYALHAEELSDYRSSGLLNSTFLNEALGRTADTPATAYSAARDGYFNPFIGTGRNNATVLAFVTQGFEANRTVGRLDAGSLSADGPLWRLPAGAVRLAVGAQLRAEGLKKVGETWTSGLTPVPTQSRYGDRTVGSLFAEIRAPLFGDGYRRAGLERLELSAAIRTERYQGGLQSTVPKFGIVWSPISSWTAKATYGRSFRAPSLGELNDPTRATPITLTANGASVLTLLVYGGNPDLKPETAQSWTAGLEYAPANRPIRINATLFNTKFENRIGEPAINNLSTVLTASDLAPFRQFVTPASSASDLALVQGYLQYATSATAALYPPQSYRAIADGRYVNAGAFEVQGLDLTGSYKLSVHDDPVVLSGNLSWLMSYSRKITSVAQKTELVGTAENPADLRARLSAAWTHGPLTTSLSLNHTGDLHTAMGARLHSQTTADLQLQYVSPAKGGAMRGAALALTVQNLFDAAPPFYDSPQGVGFDAANYDVNGRVIALQLTKAW